ncbi:hypothetical protein KJ996_02430, partial [Patescibacteria group bacterium]|nr:hypothetical protein [Patescibacteria group bacterium]
MKSTLSLVSMIALGATSLMPVTTLAMSSFEFGNSSIASSKNLTSSAGERSQEPIKGFQGFMTAAEETVTEEVEEPIPEPELYPEILPPEPLELIDDGDRGFGQHGGWTTFPLAGFMGDFRYAPPAQIYPCEPGELCPAVQGIISAATWNFYLRKGTYDVYVTWVPFASLATNAPFTVETDRTHETILINQQNKPQGPSFQGAKWQKLGTFKISNSLSVKLINKADGHVLADAIRIVRKGDEPPPPSTFGSACWQCYGDYIGQCEATTNNNCLESEEWKMKAEESCKGHCDEETGKCGLNSFSIGEKCGSQGPICGNGICEEGERPVCPPCTPDSEVCECTIGSCPQDCDVIQECPVYMLIEPTEGCEYIWIEDENGCPLPTQECEELDEAPACAPLFSNCS